MFMFKSTLRDFVNLVYSALMKSQNFKNSKRLLVFALTPGTSGADTSSLTGSSKAEDRRVCLQALM